MATSHSTPGDGVFRLAPDANTQGAYYVELVLSEGIDTLVIAYRADTWGKDFSRAIAEEFQEKQGRVRASIPYDPMDINADVISASLNGEVPALARERGSLDGVAVLILSFRK